MGTGLPPIRLAPPSTSSVTLRQPGPPSATVVPVGGGSTANVAAQIAAALVGYATVDYVDEHDGGGGGSGGPEAFTATVSAPTTLVQITHGLGFRPSGVICTDTLDNEVFWSTKTDPQPGVTELTFGFPFTGTITLS